MEAFEFPPAPEGAKRIRAIVWHDPSSVCAHIRMGKKRMRAVVRVFADHPTGTRLLWEGPFRESEDPRLRAEREAAAAFYGIA